MPDRLVPIREAAALLGVSQRWLADRCRLGQLRATRLIYGAGHQSQWKVYQSSIDDAMGVKPKRRKMDARARREIDRARAALGAPPLFGRGSLESEHTSEPCGDQNARAT